MMRPAAPADRRTVERRPAATLPPVQRIDHQRTLYWWIGLVLLGIVFSVQDVFHRTSDDAELPGPKEREREAFLALVFGKVSDADPELGMPSTLLRNQLEALKEAGYSTVRLTDVVRFLSNGTPLPSHPVLLTFDQARSESLEIVDPILASLSMNAVAFANVQALSEANLELVSVHRFEQLVWSGRWEAAVSSCAGVAATADAPPFSSYSVRRHRDQLSSWLGKPVLATDCQRSWPEETTVTSWTEALGDARIPLGFVVAAAAANYRDQPPFELRRLRVQRDWRPGDLVARLREYAPRRTTFASDFSSSDSATPWIADQGQVTAKNGVLSLRADPGEQGALAILAGSERWGDAEVRIRARTRPKGQFWIYLRRGGSRPFVRIGIVGRVALLQQAGAEGGTRQVGSRPLEADEATLTLRLMGSRALATVDGRPLSLRPAEVDRKLERGPLALAVWDPETDASAEILSVEARPLAPETAVFPASPSGEVWAAIRNRADELSVLSPEHYSWEDGEAFEMGERDSLVEVFARYHRIALMPGVVVRDEIREGQYFPFALQVLRWASDPRVDGLNLIIETDQTGPSWPSVLTELRARVRALGKELITTTVAGTGAQAGATPAEATFRLAAREPETFQIAESSLAFVDPMP